MAGRIRDEDIAVVRERSPIDEVVGEYLQLRNAGGGSLKGLCPFHDEKTPSFNVTPARGLWYCFSCAEGGDVIKFVEKIDNLSFPEAVERLAARAGIELRYEQGGHVPGQEQSQRRRLLEAHKAAAEFYAERLHGAGRPPGARVPVRAGLRAGRRRAVRRRVLARRVGGPHPPPARPRVHRRRAAGRGARQPGPARAGGPVPRPADVADQGPDRGRDRVRRAQARRRRRRPEVPEHARDPAVQEELGAVRGGPGQAGDRAAAPGGRRRGLHRRHGLPPGRGADRGGDQRHLVRRGAHQGAAAAADGRRLAPGRGHLHLRRGQRRAAASLRAFDMEERFVTQTFVAVQPDGLDPCDLRLKHGDAAVRDLVASRVPLYRVRDPQRAA